MKKGLTTMGTRATKMIISSLVVTAMAFSTTAIAGADNSAETCSAQTLHGSYLFATHGFNIVGGAAVPKAIVEGIDFNGDGTLSSPFATVSINGTIIRSSGSVGSYTVETDCRGTLTFTGGPSFDIFVGPKGKELWLIQTGPTAAPAVFEGTAIKVSHQEH
jgi:hypothetical protein